MSDCSLCRLETKVDRILELLVKRKFAAFSCFLAFITSITDITMFQVK